jgi:hypothetical protein
LLYFGSVVWENQVFGAEPQEPWSKEEEREFEAHASARLRACNVAALKAAAALVINILCIVPFLVGHRLHSHWDIAKYLVFTATGIVPLVCHESRFVVGFVAKCARDTTRISVICELLMRMRCPRWW